MLKWRIKEQLAVKVEINNSNGEKQLKKWF